MTTCPHCQTSIPRYLMAAGWWCIACGRTSRSLAWWRGYLERLRK